VEFLRAVELAERLVEGAKRYVSCCGRDLKYQAVGKTQRRRASKVTKRGGNLLGVISRDQEHQHVRVDMPDTSRR